MILSPLSSGEMDGRAERRLVARQLVEIHDRDPEIRFWSITIRDCTIDWRSLAA